MSGLVLRAAGPDDDEAIRRVIEASFPDNVKADADLLRWQYRANPFGPTVSWVWEDAGEVVAHYTSIPLPVVLGGKPAIVGEGIDAATAPSHRGQGLFEPLARALYEDTGRHGMPLTICYPNANSVAGITRAGREPIAQLPTFV